MTFEDIHYKTSASITLSAAPSLLKIPRIAYPAFPSKSLQARSVRSYAGSQCANIIMSMLVAGSVGFSSETTISLN